MQPAVVPPFAGAVRFNPHRSANPIGFLTALAALAMSSLGVTAIVVGRRRQRDYGRLRCASDLPVVGVPLDYHGNYWADRGRQRYYEARAQGAATADEIALKILEADLAVDADPGLLAQCLKQFPPHDLTHPRNRQLWEGLVAEVEGEMGREA